MAAPERSDLEEGTRLVREVLNAIPPETDESEDAVVRRIAEGIASAAELALEGEPERNPGNESHEG
jgi:hypothetical protein